MQWDLNSGQITQKYDQHLGAVNTITFIDENRRFISTSVSLLWRCLIPFLDASPTFFFFLSCFSDESFCHTCLELKLFVNYPSVLCKDDKKILVWEFDLPVPIKYISEPHMHSIPAMSKHPSSEFRFVLIGSACVCFISNFPFVRCLCCWSIHGQPNRCLSCSWSCSTTSKKIYRAYKCRICNSNRIFSWWTVSFSPSLYFVQFLLI